MSRNEKSSSGSPWIGIIVGAILMVGGTYISAKNLIDTSELTKKGLEIDPGMTIATIGVLMILFPMIKSFFITPLSEAITHRNQELERTFADAENLRSEMQKLRAEYEQRLTATEAAARAQIEAQIKEAQYLRQTLNAEAAARADELVKRAEQEIESEKARAITELRLHIVDLTLAATEKVLGQTVDAAINKRLVNEFIDK